MIITRLHLLIREFTALKSERQNLKKHLPKNKKILRNKSPEQIVSGDFCLLDFSLLIPYNKIERHIL